MRILLIGGTGHIGMHLVPLLLSQGREVYVATRGMTQVNADFWQGVHFVTCDSSNLDSLKPIANKYNFDTVIDFPGTGYATWNVFCDIVDHVIVCGSMWMYGRPNRVPTPELAQGSCPFSVYANRYMQIQQMLKESKEHRAEFTAIMPSNICGPGKIPLDTMGGRSLAVHQANMRGETVFLPEGPEALIAPCDACDLAQLFLLAINRRFEAAGQVFNGGPQYAITATEFVNTYSKIYGVNIPISYISWSQYKEINTDQGAWWHFYADMCPDISKAVTLLGYKPQYTPEQSMERAVIWMRDQKHYGISP